LRRRLTVLRHTTDATSFEPETTPLKQPQRTGPRRTTSDVHGRYAITLDSYWNERRELGNQAKRAPEL